MRKSMTYGTMPSNDELSEAFARECPLGVFSFGNDERFGTDDVEESDLFEEMNKALTEWNDGNEKAGEWLSVVLSCLGFEWI